jgi:hypothetical protein
MTAESANIRWQRVAWRACRPGRPGAECQGCIWQNWGLDRSVRPGVCKSLSPCYFAAVFLAECSRYAEAVERGGGDGWKGSVMLGADCQADIDKLGHVDSHSTEFRPRSGLAVAGVGCGERVAPAHWGRTGCSNAVLQFNASTAAPKHNLGGMLYCYRNACGTGRSVPAFVSLFLPDASRPVFLQDAAGTRQAVPRGLRHLVVD